MDNMEEETKCNQRLCLLLPRAATLDVLVTGGEPQAPWCPVGMGMDIVGWHAWHLPSQ